MKGTLQKGWKIWNKFSKWIKEIGADFLSWLGEKFSSFADYVVGKFQGILDAAADIASKIPGIDIEAPKLRVPGTDVWMSDMAKIESSIAEGRSLMDGFREDMVGLAGGEAAKEQMNAFEDLIDSSYHGIKDTGDMISRASRELDDAAEDIKGQDWSVENIAGNISDAFKSVTGGKKKEDGKGRSIVDMITGKGENSSLVDALMGGKGEGKGKGQGIMSLLKGREEGETITPSSLKQLVASKTSPEESGGETKNVVFEEGAIPIDASGADAKQVSEELRKELGRYGV